MHFRYAIIDDAAFIREIFKTHLDELGGFCVGEADDGSAAVELIRQTHPDVIFLDIVLPGQNGVQLIPRILEASKGARIVVCSTLAEESIINDCLSSGAIGFISKPFEKSAIKAQLRSLGLIRQEATK